MKIALFLIFLIFGVSLSLYLGGCESVATPTGTFVKDTVMIKWTKTDEVRKRCRSETALACSYVERNPCEIITYPSASFELLGHEVAHCFTGDFHK